MDTQTPYRVLGTQQDNSSVSVPSRSPGQSITWQDCYIAGTGESGYIAAKPDDPSIVFVGAVGSSPGGGNSLQRYDHRTKQIRLVTTWPETMTGYGAGEHKYRFGWTYPIFYSKHAPNTVYIGGNHVFKSSNEGQSWELASPDLTRADPDKLQATGGPVNKDAVGAETYATVFALAESPFEPGVLWAGSDDGLVHLSRDGGESWNDITPKDLPEWSLVSMLEPSPHSPATVYLAATKYKLDDYTPYLFKTTDYGESWQRIDTGIPRTDFTRAIREDPNREGLLYVGTETGLYLSFDAGENWQRFQLNLPVTPVYDFKVKDADLVVATHGRSFWILDDLTPLYQYEDGLLEQPAHLFKPRDSARILPTIFEGAFKGAPGKNYMGSLGVVAAFTEDRIPEGGLVATYLDSGDNPPKGAIFTYYLKEPQEKISLRVTNENGDTVREFVSFIDEDREKIKADKHLEVGIPARQGWNRFVWDMRYPKVSKLEGSDLAADTLIPGPLVAPGRYTVTLRVNNNELSETFNVIPDPMAGEVAEHDLAAQFELWQNINRKLEHTVTAINRMRSLRNQLEPWAKREDETAAAALSLKEKVLDIEKQLAVPDLRPGWGDTNNSGVRLLAKLANLIPVVSTGNYKPTDQAWEAFEDFSGQIDEQLERFDDLVATDVAAFNDTLARGKSPHVGV